jgi:zinc transporter, ZIP family
LAHGLAPVEEALEASVEGEGSWGDFAGYAILLAGGVVIGLMSLVYYGAWIKRRRSSDFVGPGAAAVDEFASRSVVERLAPAQQLALLIAIGIGLHNLAEGLAIGKPARPGRSASPSL